MVHFKSLKTKLLNLATSLFKKEEERKRTEKGLKENPEMLRIIASIARDAIIMINGDGKIVYWNPAAEHIFGFSPDEVLSRDLSNCIIPERYREDHIRGFTRFRETGKGKLLGDTVELQGLRKNGEEFPIGLSLSAVQIENDWYAVGIAQDITRRKSAEEELRKHRSHLEVLVNERTSELSKTNKQLLNEISHRENAEKKQELLLEKLAGLNKGLKDFANIVSHDLKAPLRGISALTTLISTDYAKILDDEGKNNLNLLLGRVKRMYSLIDGISKYSMVGSVQEDRTTINLNELLPEIIDFIAPPESIEIKIENYLPTIYFEKTRISQVFQNLLCNAVKSINKPKGKIIIKSVDEGSFWKFSITDNGLGIDEKYFERIFQVFQTLSPLDDDSDSTGIGLTLVRKIIDMHGGRVWVESKIGYGSVFFFSFPKEVEG